MNQKRRITGDARSQDIQYNIDPAVLVKELEKIEEEGQQEQRDPKGAENDLEAIRLQAEDLVKNSHNQ
jgi:hypothetical protein